ncbi:MAG: sulfite exporter TauE/SafE family protein [Candidatus Methanosuratus sp.]|nr:sulfite exporter TauE/SafE family protein [Candidatus Methanosuratincola sp.]
MFSIIETVIILLIGAGAGLTVGIMGGSGVMVVVPMLTLLLSFPVHTAIGTSLLIDVIATVVTSFIYHRHRNIYIKPGLWIALGSIVGAQAGSIFADMIPPLGMSNLFGLMLIPMGVLLWVRGIRHTTEGLKGNDSNDAIRLPAQTRKQRLIALGLGLFVGIMCGVFGAGGGGMILIILVFVLHYPLHLAVGTSSFIMAITAASGTAGYILHGNIDIYAALIASVSTLLAASLGALVANRVSEKTLGRIIGTVLITLGIAMIATQYMVAQ